MWNFLFKKKKKKLFHENALLMKQKNLHFLEPYIYILRN